MKTLLIIAAVLALAWIGSRYQAEIRQLFTTHILGQSGEVEYAKCTTPDGNIIYGTAPFAEKCQKIEIIRKQTTVVPALSH